MFLSKGFRPFFLLALAWSLLALLLWIMFLSGNLQAGRLQISSVLWHGRAMIFAYGAAVVCGFLLTAASNWSGRPTLQGGPLLLIAVAWLLARIGPWTGTSAGWLLAIIGDAVFWGGFVLGLSKPLLATKDAKNFWTFVPKLVVFGVSAMIFDLGVLNPAIASWQPTLLLAGLLMMVAIIIAMGIRIIPLFIAGALKKKSTPRQFGAEEITDLIAMSGFVISLLIWPDSPVVTLCAVVAVAVNGRRMWRWYDAAIWQHPMLWILFLGFAVLLFGILLLGFSAVGWVPYFPALHAVAYGGIGLMTTGMMVRVSLGHTGRSILQAPGRAVVAFVMLAVGTGIRVAGPWLDAVNSLHYLLFAGLLWILAMALLLWLLVPILLRPRRLSENRSRSEGKRI